MKVFVDANVLVAVMNREYPLYSHAARVLSLHNKMGLQLFTSPMCLAIAFYFSSKKSGEAVAKKKTEILSENIFLTTVNEDVVRQALKNQKIRDVEDGMEYYSAIREGCTCIITEDKGDFHFSAVQVENCEEFLMNFRNNTFF